MRKAFLFISLLASAAAFGQSSPINTTALTTTKRMNPPNDTLVMLLKDSNAVAWKGDTLYRAVPLNSTICKWVAYKTASGGDLSAYLLKVDSFGTQGYTPRGRAQKIADSLGAIIDAIPDVIPGGSDSYIQTNDAGGFGADSRLRFNKTTKTLYSGRVEVNDSTDNGTPDAAIRVNRTLDNTYFGNSGHGVRDQTIFVRGNGTAYAAFDGAMAMNGVHDHGISFQGRIDMNGGTINDLYGSGTYNKVHAGTVDRMTDFESWPQILGGTITNRIGLKIRRPSQSGGTIVNNYGIYIDKQGNTGTNVYGIYTEDSATVHLNGKAEFNNEVTFNTGVPLLMGNPVSNDYNWMTYNGGIRYDTDKYKVSDNALKLIWGGKGFEFYTAPLGTAGGDITYQRRLTVGDSSGGNVTVEKGYLQVNRDIPAFIGHNGSNYPEWTYNVNPYDYKRHITDVGTSLELNEGFKLKVAASGSAGTMASWADKFLVTSIGNLWTAGTATIGSIPTATSPDSILVPNNNRVEKIAISDLVMSGGISTDSVNHLIKIKIDSLAADSVAVDLSPYARSGSYTPTFTNVTNFTSASLSANSTTYMVVDSMVYVEGYALITVGAGSTCDVRISLPVSSNFTSATADLSGSSSSRSTDFSNGDIEADTTNDEAVLSFDVVTPSAAQKVRFHFQYKVK